MSQFLAYSKLHWFSHIVYVDMLIYIHIEELQSFSWATTISRQNDSST
jgi:hypothetical protein